MTSMEEKNYYDGELTRDEILRAIGNFILVIGLFALSITAMNYYKESKVLKRELASQTARTDSCLVVIDSLKKTNDSLMHQCVNIPKPQNIVNKAKRTLSNSEAAFWSFIQYLTTDDNANCRRHHRHHYNRN